MGIEDIAEVVGLQRACFPAPFPEALLWQPTHLTAHLERFPAGQFVAIGPTGEVLASASASRIAEALWLAHADWDTTLGGPTFSTFDGQGSTLYGADISVHPDWRGQGIARQLYQARFRLMRELGLTRYGTACRLPGCAAWVQAEPGRANADYVTQVGLGQISDRTLTSLLSMGCQVVGVIDQYMEDAESRDAAALLEWKP